jgi:hypothetical protein
MRIAALAIALALSAAYANAADFLLHADKAEDMVRNVDPSRNYYTSNTYVYWTKDANGNPDYWNYSTCAPFVTQVLKATYTFTTAQFKARFTNSTSPSSAIYNDLIVKESGFTRIQDADDIQRGDIIGIVYKPCANAGDVTGHTMIVAGAPVPIAATAPLIDGTQQFALPIYDSTSSPHGGVVADNPNFESMNRSSWHNGASAGYVRIYQNVETGQIAGYSWSLSDSKYYAVDSCRSLAVGRMR